MGKATTDGYLSAISTCWVFGLRRGILKPGEMLRITDTRRRRLHRLALLLALATVTVALVTSCGWLPARVGPDHYDGSQTVFFHDLDGVDDRRTVRYSVAVGDSPKDVYLVLTNPTTSPVGTPGIELRTAIGAPGESRAITTSPAERSAAIADLTSGPVALRDHPGLIGWEPPTIDRTTPRSVAEPSASTAPTFAAVPGPDRYTDEAPEPGEYTIWSLTNDDTYDFYTFDPDRPRDPNAYVVIPSILAARRADVVTPHGPKTVEIWVEEAEWDGTDQGNGPSSRKITPTKADAMVDAFLLPGDDNDIYDWVSAIFGEEWSDEAASYRDTIDGHDTITILLYDIDSGSSGGIIVGFFWAKDNFLRREIEYSNERIMFYINSRVYGTTEVEEGSWSIDNDWPSEIVSTLAHELQHMINFHERPVLRGASTPTWLDEAMSLAAEDLVEWKRGRAGPRGVDPLANADGSAGPAGNNRGRLPLYNVANDISLTGWGATQNILESYSMSYAVAAFLGRNFGGAELFGEMNRVGSSNPNKVLSSSIAAASGRPGLTLKQLLPLWGAAVLLSDGSHPAPYRLNPGTWMESQTNGIDYRLGSIDHYRYANPPVVHTAPIREPTMPAASKMLYLVGAGLTGTVELDIDFQTGMDFAVVLK